MLNSTAPNMEKEVPRWSLSSRAEGHCGGFNREAISLIVPPTSGVYGLFNADCQLFIGESANVREALLRHEGETDFPSQHLRPTGFTFELCAAELRKLMANELIAKFHPVLQTEAVFAEKPPPSNDPIVNEGGLRSKQLNADASHQDSPARVREKRPTVRRRVPRKPAAMLAAVFIASAVLVIYFATPADDHIQKKAQETIKTSDPNEIGLRSQNASSIDPAGGRANQSAAPTSAAPDVQSFASAPNAALQLAEKSTLIVDITRSVKGANVTKQWSVQVAAAPAKDVADTLVERLKAEGYDSYVARAEVKGQTYYRVRVGQFDSREKAESVHRLLASEEAYRDAYLTRN